MSEALMVGDCVSYLGKEIPSGPYLVIQNWSPTAVRLNHFDTRPYGWVVDAAYVRRVTRAGECYE